MWQQKSYSSEGETGALYLVPTPVGNLEDITYRAVRMLKEVDLIAAEDTRQTKKLCNHFEIDTKLVSYHEHNKEKSGYHLIEQLKDGMNIALVSDAGMPAISDPGYELVVAAIAEQIAVIPLPGANAALPSLVASGLNSERFYFFGFLNRQKKQKVQQLEGIKLIPVPIIFYEAPHRLKETLKTLLEVLGNRHISVTRELSKKYEEFIRGTIEELLQWSETNEVRGEFCLVVDGAMEGEGQEEDWWAELTVMQHVNHYISLKMTSKDAIKQAAKDRNVPKREVYAVYHSE
ncbi:16S rRNA (cytidine(1402)-2'-O)-methyltransferase [Anaerobacillus sp. MEB173]|uniref:16S rRNA (cytidine(1402)-2'-O)-methyltransferase n=1 Tax=Anaerobacillus sp. MEB173 TaxID=3383345 RepID=UPI003F8F9FF1